MKTINRFRIKPALPQRLKPLLKLAYNLWWTWTPKAIDLFRAIHLSNWTKFNHNPIQLLGSIQQDRFKELEDSESFCSNMDILEVELEAHLLRPTWFSKVYNRNKKSSSSEGQDVQKLRIDHDFSIAYFSAEFGLHECMPIYSGGLGVLSGDHLKSANELGLPLVGIGLAYHQGYFHQFLNTDGWQQEVYPENDFTNMPMTLECQDNGFPIKLEIDLSDRILYAQIWRVQVGKIPLYLLDANIESNSLEDREITAQLYGGDQENRIKQEILLGIGGMKILKALGISATVFHMNEGHSAFLAVERISDLIENHSLSFIEAKEAVSSSNVFTTHTPVPAGLDKFQPSLIDKYLLVYYDKLKMSREDFLALGGAGSHDEPFSMAKLAISLSQAINGVSKLHGQVSKKMWQKTWPDVPFSEIPIQSITNGIHIRSWISDEMTRLFERYLDPLWIEDPVSKEVWQKVDHIPNSELWRSQERLKERLISFARYRLRSELQRVGAPQFEINRVDEVLDPEALTICFSRRFATYKRATLIFRDLDRLAKILNNKEQPVQLIFSGKAHPKDNEGKELIRQIFHLSQDDAFRTKIMFIEDYDISIARYMVQGADIWLNTPRRPLEASGTSGMKVAANGGLNLSILDGWWCEAYDTTNGWAIGGGEIYEDHDEHDEVESNALYNLLEHEIIPLYYHREQDGFSRPWIAKMKASIKTIAPVFNSNRMVKEYAERFYFPANKNWQKLTEHDFEKTKSLVTWKTKIKKNWDGVKVENIEYEKNKTFEVGSQIEVYSKINLNSLKPEDILVELYYGDLDSTGDILEGDSIVMDCLGSPVNSLYKYFGKIDCRMSGQYGFAIRVLPKHEDLVNKFNPGFIHWG